MKKTNYFIVGFAIIVLLVLSSVYAQSALTRPISMIFDTLRSLIAESFSFFGFLKFILEDNPELSFKLLFGVLIGVIAYFGMRLIFPKGTATVISIVLTLMLVLVIPSSVIQTLVATYGALLIALFILGYLIVVYLIVYKAIKADTKAKHALRIILLFLFFIVYTTIINYPAYSLASDMSLSKFGELVDTISGFIMLLFVIAMIIEGIALIFGAAASAGSWAIERLPESLGRVIGGIAGSPNKLKRGFRRAYTRGERRANRAINRASSAIEEELSRLKPIQTTNDDVAQSSEAIHNATVNQIEPVISDPRERIKYSYVNAFETLENEARNLKENALGEYNLATEIRAKAHKELVSLRRAVRWMLNELIRIKRIHERIKGDIKGYNQVINDLEKARQDPKIEMGIRSLEKENVLNELIRRSVRSLDNVSKLERDLSALLQKHENELTVDLSKLEDDKLRNINYELSNSLRKLSREIKNKASALTSKISEGKKIATHEPLSDKDYEKILGIVRECAGISGQIAQLSAQISSIREKIESNNAEIYKIIERAKVNEGNHRKYLAQERDYINEISAMIKDVEKYLREIRSIIKQARDVITQKKELKLRHHPKALPPHT